ncbi:glycosyltransferase [Pedobacter mucosus]|uniref:glycosyltransferase n=1 Tax=Pedobacter mucosus TaxID=2895286 RepID=UPI001EE45BA5|nr:glycosyltransferase [Pedobacter mucosus]UKT62598.1 glycosyltransferase [Pedobacter mucosus]
MKRIAFISEHASPIALLGGTDNGGQNVYVAEIALQLVKKGYRIDVFTRREDIISPEVNLFATNVNVILIDAGPNKPLPKEDLLPYMVAFRKGMENYIQKESIKYDLIHANFFMSGLVAMELKNSLNLPFVITFHALGHIRKLHQKEMDRFPKERVDIEEQIVQQANCIIAECPQDREDLINYYQADPQKIAMVPCGFNPKDFYPVAKMMAKVTLDLNPDEKIVLQLGRMVRRKGIDNVIIAFSKIKYEGKIRLIIVGGENGSSMNDDELNRLKQLVTKLSIEDKVSFVGPKNRDVLRYYYSAADLFITTPWYEPFGITPLEAMACGTPVIGSNVGGIKYTVKNGETGYLVNPNAPNELCERISILLNDEELLSKMSDNALNHVNKNFTWEIVAQQIDDCYQEIADKINLIHERETLMIKEAFKEAEETFAKTASLLTENIAQAGEYLSKALQAGNKVLVCGNGGSAAESQHFVAELVGRFEIPHRKGLPALSLNSDMAIITAWANDFGYDDVFARQVQAFGNKGDILVSISSSGNSDNIIKAMQMAHKKEMFCINLLGKDGGRALSHGNLNLVVPSNSTQRIQEMHLHMVHLLCTMIENRLFNEVYTSKTLAKERSLKYNFDTDVDLPVYIKSAVLKSGYGN